MILCKQKLLQWDIQNYQIIKNELGINIERISEIMPNIITLQTESGSWMRERFELNSWNIGKSIAIYKSENTLVISVRFPVPPIVLTLQKN